MRARLTVPLILASLLVLPLLVFASVNIKRVEGDSLIDLGPVQTVIGTNITKPDETTALINNLTKTCDPGQFISEIASDGTISCGSGTGSPGGVDQNVQFNDNGSFGGSNTFLWDKFSNSLFVGALGSSPSLLDPAYGGAGPGIFFNSNVDRCGGCGSAALVGINSTSGVNGATTSFDRGLIGYFVNNATATLSIAEGVLGQVQNNSVDDIAFARGGAFRVFSSNAGDIRDAVSLYLQTPGGGAGWDGQTGTLGRASLYVGSGNVSGLAVTQVYEVAIVPFTGVTALRVNGVDLFDFAGTSSSFLTHIQVTTPTAARTITIPNNSGTIPLTSGGTAGRAVCWKADGITLGYCSTVVDAGGACTCN